MVLKYKGFTGHRATVPPFGKLVVLQMHTDAIFKAAHRQGLGLGDVSFLVI